ncbi:MAG: TVP38/TMEM64 family protein [Pseudomonadota bacterium]
MIKRWLPLILVLGLLATAYLFGLQEYLTLSNLIAQRESLSDFVSGNLVLALFGYLVMYALLVAISFPGASLITMSSGLLFGTVLGGTVTVVGATLGAIIIFLVARSSFGDFLQSKAGPFVNRMIEGFQKDAFQYLLTIRLTPVFPFWVVNIVPALLNMKLAPYAIATFFGIIPGTFVYASIGTGLDSVFTKVLETQPGCVATNSCEFDLTSLVTPEIILALVGLAVISFLPFIIRKLKGTKSEPETDETQVNSGKNNE